MAIFIPLLSILHGGVAAAPLSDSVATNREGTFSNGSRSYQVRYHTMTVPENRSDRSSRSITIPIVRILTPNSAPLEPIFYLTGGPGVSNLRWKPSDSLLAEHDVVMVGYRGVDGSSVLECPAVEEAIKSSDDLLSDTVLRRIGDAWKADAEALRQQEVDLNGYTIQEVIGDVEQARIALGYGPMNLLSESYGTRIAYFFGVVHPASVHRSVMIGVNPPGRFIWESSRIDKQLRQYAKLWEESPEGKGSGVDLYGTMDTVLRAMPKRWLFIPVNEGKVRTVSFALMFHRGTAAMVFDAYRAAAEGDPSGLAVMSMASDFVLPPLFVWGDLASKAVSADHDPLRDHIRETSSHGTMFGSPLSRLLWGSLQYGQWPIRMLPERYRTLVRSDVPTLMLSGSLDLSTPAENAANELLPFLPNGQQIVLREYGHVADVWTVDPPRTQQLVARYFREGTADSTEATVSPVDFSVGWGFPIIGKIMLATGAAAAAAILYGIVVLL
ncbi:MAG: alpha/beta hydrolase [Bacteroidetes bacterium]|nr:alpha/beta hydrolase [Bacteroidota bacterium]